MPITIEKDVATTDTNLGGRHASQTSTMAQVPTRGEAKDAQADRSNAWVWYVVGLVDLALAVRLIFALLGARSVGFADLLNSLTNPLIAPFRGIFPNQQASGSYFDVAVLAAIIVYPLVGWIVSGLIDLAMRPNNSQQA